jgi:hypothetical protein
MGLPGGSVKNAERYPTKELAAIEIYGREGSGVATIQNLSETGACLKWKSSGDVSLKNGDLVRMTVVLKALRREHKINAEVVWIEGEKTGVHFLSSRDLLNRMIAKNS